MDQVSCMYCVKIGVGEDGPEFVMLFRLIPVLYQYSYLILHMT